MPASPSTTSRWDGAETSSHTGFRPCGARIGAELRREEEITRAREIARSFTDPTRRCAELLEAASALAEAHGNEHAVKFAADAYATARDVIEPDERAYALADVARMFARLVPADDALTIVVNEGCSAMQGIGDLDRRESVGAHVAEAAARIGRPEIAGRLARSATSPTRRTQALQLAARGAAGAGDVSAAQEFLKAIELLDQRAWGLGGVIAALARADRGKEVRTLAHRSENAAGNISDLEWRARLLGAVAVALAMVGATQRARFFVALARSAVSRVPRSQNAEPRLPVSVLRAMVILGDVDDAVRIARSVGGAKRRAEVAAELARAGRPGEAEALADEIDEAAPGPEVRKAERELMMADVARGMSHSDVPQRLEALATLARIAADAGDTDRAIRLCERIESATKSGAVRYVDEAAPRDLAEALAAAGYLDQALALAASMGDPHEVRLTLIRIVLSARYDTHADVLATVRSLGDEESVATGLVMVADTAALAGNIALATSLAEESVAMAARTDNPAGPMTAVSVLPKASRVMAVIGNSERACSIAALLTEDEPLRDITLLNAAEAAADAGHVDGAEHIARAVSHPTDRAMALASAAKAAAVAGRLDRARALARASADEPLGKARPTIAAAAESGPGFSYSMSFDALGANSGSRMAMQLLSATASATVRLALGGEGPATAESEEAQPGPGFTVESFIVPAMSYDPRTEVTALLTRVFADIGDSAAARATADATLAAARAIDPPRYKSSALSDAAEAMAACGDIDQALAIADEATAVAQEIHTWRKQNAAERRAMHALSLAARAAARNGDLAKAGDIATSIAEDDIRAETLADIAQDLALSGDETAAVEIARSIGDPLRRARALASIAEIITGPRARNLLGQALQIGNWEPCLAALAKIEPAAVAAIAAEVSRLTPTTAAAALNRAAPGQDDGARRAAALDIERAFAVLSKPSGPGAPTRTRGPAPEVAQQAVPADRDATRLAMEALSRGDPAAADLARICAFFAPDPIPPILLASVAALPEGLAVGIADQAAWTRVADQLQRYSLARVDQRGLLMHRVSQAALRDQMPPARAVLAQARAQAALTACVPEDADDPSGWPALASLRPHVLAAERTATAQAGLRDLARRVCWYLLHSGDIRPATTSPASFPLGGRGSWAATPTPPLAPTRPWRLRCARWAAMARLGHSTRTSSISGCGRSAKTTPTP